MKCHFVFIHKKRQEFKNDNICFQELSDLITGNEDVVVRLSSASLASRSSSGSDSRLKSSVEILEPVLQLVNSTSGSDVTDNTSPVFSKPNSSTGAIPKSISFDVSAERGDKEMLDDDQKGKRGFFGKLKLSLRNRRGKSLRGLDDMNRCYDKDSGNDGVGEGRHGIRRITTSASTCSTNSGN